MKAPTRHQQRVNVFQLLFETEFRKEETPINIYQSALIEREIKDTRFTHNLYFGTIEQLSSIDEVINMHSLNWKTSRMNRVTLSIIRLAVYEMMSSSAPPKVIINEAIEIVKEFGDEDGFSLVNGILNSYAKSNGLIEPVK